MGDVRWRPRAALPSTRTGRGAPGGQGSPMNKVARVTLVFWMMKMCATTLGESAWEHTATGVAPRGQVLAIVFAALLAWQVASPRFQPVRYWLLVLATGAVAAMAADAMAATAWLGYGGGSVLVAAAFVATLGLWLRTGGSVAVDAITDARNEAFYWTAIVLANALGTGIAEGFATASSLGLGTELVLVGGLVTVIAAAAYFTRFDLAVLFWIAIVFTRPFGASFGDFLSGPGEEGGLALGTSGAALVLAVLLLAFLVHARAAALRARRWGR